MIGIIAAITMNGVIGFSDGRLPFDYPEDQQYFKETTLNQIIIMGRKTFEAIGKPLPKRTNVVITSQKIDNDKVITFTSIPEALDHFDNLKNKKEIWFIGGNQIYEEGMKYANVISLTISPTYEYSNDTIKFPFINPLTFLHSMTHSMPIKPVGNITQLDLVKYIKIH